MRNPSSRNAGLHIRTLGMSQNRGTQHRLQNAIILIMGTPKKVPNLGNSHFSNGTTAPTSVNSALEKTLTTLPQTNMETHIVPFRRTVVFIGLLLGFHVSFSKAANPEPSLAFCPGKSYSKKQVEVCSLFPE